MIWIIGSSSKFSKAVASQFNDVKSFGRANINYNDSFHKFIEQQTDMPDKIFINIKLEQDVAVEADADDDEYKEMLDKFLPVWLWKIRLYSYFFKQEINCTICEVTSSITQWPHNHRLHMPYASLRAMSQQAGLAHNTKNLKIFHVSPSNINDENILQYAKRTAKMINNPNKIVNKIIDLENIT